VFEQLYARLYEGGALVTYCSKGVVRRAMQTAGFMVGETARAAGEKGDRKGGEEVAIF